MPYKDPEKQKACKREWYQRNKKITQERSNANRRKRRVILRGYGQALKSALGCVVCGENDHILLDFHHVDPTKKKYAISRMMNGACGASRRVASINRELIKCVVICKRHHALHHDGRQKLYKKYILPHQKKMKELMEYTYEQVSSTQAVPKKPKG
jgi:hypothetical protein